MHIFAPFCTERDHFTKTGSGHTYGKLKKRDACSCSWHKLAFYSAAPAAAQQAAGRSEKRTFDLIAMIASSKRDPLLVLEVRRWDGTLVSQLRSDEHEIRYVDFSFDGRLLLITTPSNILVMDVRTGYIINTMDRFSSLSRASFSPGSMTFAAGESDNDFLHFFNYDSLGCHMEIIPAYYQEDWFERDRQLSAKQSAAIIALGYKSPQQWRDYDADGARTPGSAEGLEWWHLTEQEKQAAAAFGWTQSSWNLDNRILASREKPRDTWFEISPSLKYIACAAARNAQEGIGERQAEETAEMTLKIVRLSDGVTVYACRCGPLPLLRIMFRWSPCSNFLAIGTTWRDNQWKQPKEWTDKHKDTRMFTVTISVLDVRIQEGQMGRHTFRGDDPAAFPLTQLSAVNIALLWETHSCAGVCNWARRSM